MISHTFVVAAMFFRKCVGKWSEGRGVPEHWATIAPTYVWNRSGCFALSQSKNTEVINLKGWSSSNFIWRSGLQSSVWRGGFCNVIQMPTSQRFLRSLIFTWYCCSVWFSSLWERKEWRCPNNHHVESSYLPVTSFCICLNASWYALCWGLWGKTCQKHLHVWIPLDACFWRPEEYDRWQAMRMSVKGAMACCFLQNLLQYVGMCSMFGEV